MMFRYLILGLLSCLVFVASAIAGSNDVADLNRGRLIYLKGQLPDGMPLVGNREGIAVSGSQAACVNCHRESGFGGVEGNEIILPITGFALFGGADPVIVEDIKRFSTTLTVKHQPYDDASLAKVIREGSDLSGHSLNPLMPRYNLSDHDVSDLIAYLRTLSVNPSPGVEDKEIHIATVIAPSVNDHKKQAFIQTINAMVNQHNVNVVSGLRQRVSPIERRMQNRRKWRLDIWALNGPSSSWQAQLDEWQKKDPVFAVVSGLASDEWEPVQNFCEATQVPCWFPSLEVVPDKAQEANYSLYFNQGIVLDARVIGHQLLKDKPTRVIQIYDESFAAKNAKAALQDVLNKQSIKTENVFFDSNKPKDISAKLNELKSADAVVLWLDRDGFDTFSGEVNNPNFSIFYSEALTGDVDAKLNMSWLDHTWKVSKLERPELRSLNLNRFKDWLNFRRIPLVDEKMQSEVYFSVNSFSWMVSSLLNNFYSHYLIERAESNLSMREAMQVQEEVQAMMMGGESKRPQFAGQNDSNTKSNPTKLVNRELLLKRESTSAYPRLSLGIGQRFASKGAFLIKQAKSPTEVSVNWVVP